MKGKIILVFSIMLIIFFQCNTGSKDVYLFSYFTGNGEDGLHLAYSYDGYVWKELNEGKSYLKPEAGNDKLMRDPCIVQGSDGLFHMVWTVSWNEKGIGYANSKDLIHWSEQKFIPVMEHEADAKNCWAPEVFYDEAAQQYLIFWATTIPGRYPETDFQDNRGVEEQGYNHRIYYTTTKDFINFSETALFYNHGFNVIDATMINTGSQFMMFIKDESNKPFTPQKNIKTVTSNIAVGPYSAPSEPITGDYWAEGPTAIKIGDYWHLYFDKYMLHKYGLLVSKDLKTWEDKSDNLKYPDGLRHGTVFRVSKQIFQNFL